jgi:hypothetical protein
MSMRSVVWIRGAHAASPKPVITAKVSRPGPINSQADEWQLTSSVQGSLGVITIMALLAARNAAKTTGTEKQITSVSRRGLDQGQGPRCGVLATSRPTTTRIRWSFLTGKFFLKGTPHPARAYGRSVSMEICLYLA